MPDIPAISPRIDNPAAVVIGGSNIDQKSQTTVAPVAGTSNPGHSRTSLGGVGRNVAENLARLGVTTSLITAVGNDAAGDRLTRETEAAGVDMRYRVVTQAPTGSYVAVLDADGEMIIAVAAMDSIDELTIDVLAARRELIANARVIVLDCNVPHATLRRAAELARQNDVPIIVDPVSVAKAPRLSSLLDAGVAVHTITPNLAELRALSGESALSGSGTPALTDLSSAALQLHSRGVENVWISLGAEGSFLSARTDGTVRARAVARCAGTLLDATGAGDAMLAGYVAGLLAGLDAHSAADYGRAAAAITAESAQTVNPAINLATLVERVQRCSDSEGFSQAKFPG